MNSAMGPIQGTEKKVIKSVLNTNAEGALAHHPWWYPFACSIGFCYCRTPETRDGYFRIIMSGPGKNHEWVHEWKNFPAVEFMSNHE